MAKKEMTVKEKILAVKAELQKEKEAYEASVKSKKAELANLLAEKRNEELTALREKIKYLRKNKDIILPLMEHDRTSCSDESPCNGWEDDGRYRCAKCALIELIDGDPEPLEKLKDFSLTASFSYNYND